MQQKLRLNPVYVGRVEQSLKQVLEQRRLDLTRWLRRNRSFRILSRQCKHIPNDCLGFFVHAEGVSGDLSRFKRGVPRQQMVVEILHQQPGRSAIIPVQPLAPQFTFGIEHWPQNRCSKMPKIEDLDSHASCHVSLVRCGRFWAGVSNTCQEGNTPHDRARRERAFRSLCHV